LDPSLTSQSTEQAGFGFGQDNDFCIVFSHTQEI
jgi:hypothetical protein